MEKSSVGEDSRCGRGKRALSVGGSPATKAVADATRTPGRFAKFVDHGRVLAAKPGCELSGEWPRRSEEAAIGRSAGTGTGTESRLQPAELASRRAPTNEERSGWMRTSGRLKPGLRAERPAAGEPCCSISPLGAHAYSQDAWCGTPCTTTSGLASMRAWQDTKTHGCSPKRSAV